MGDHNHNVEVHPRAMGRRWVAVVDGEVLKNRSGKERLYKTAKNATLAADFDAWIRDQTNL